MNGKHHAPIVEPVRIKRSSFIEIVAERQERYFVFRRLLPSNHPCNLWSLRIILVAAAGVLDPIVGSHRKTEDEQFFYDRLCANPIAEECDGEGGWCKLTRGHPGECISSWLRAAIET